MSKGKKLLFLVIAGSVIFTGVKVYGNLASYQTKAEDLLKQKQPQKAAAASASTESKSQVAKKSVVDITSPDSITVLVNKNHPLIPSDYKPQDLVIPNIPFSFSGSSPKKFMRKPAADALEKLFAKANEDNIHLFGVSAYRSYQTQVAIFANNVKQQGEKTASQVSAHPGQSEHQTGLAIDVSSRSAKLGLEPIFGDTKEGKWLAQHAADFGFIIRYPEGKENITGYTYEPWHIRYVGVETAKAISEKGITLEEYVQQY
jgi:zinc D-Ala-D-Ala carboxypeptidase